MLDVGVNSWRLEAAGLFVIYRVGVNNTVGLKNRHGIVPIHASPQSKFIIVVVVGLAS